MPPITRKTQATAIPAPKARAAGAADPAASFDAAYQALSTTRDPKQAAELIAQMRGALVDLRADGRDVSAYEEKMTAGAERAAALPILAGLPDVPRPQITRNPDASTASPSREQSSEARAWMNGYDGGSEVPAWRRILGKLFPSLNPTEATPAFDKLTGAQKGQFLAIARQADASGQVALHQLLVSGKLSPALLGQLSQLTKQSLSPDVDRQKLLSETLVEIQDPVTISQEGRGTCAATSVQILMALEAPERYAKLVSDLATPAGTAKLPGGTVLKREPDWNANSDGGRSLPSRLIQPAFMEFANGELDYSNSDDMDVNANGERTPSGLTADQAVNLLDATGLDAKGFETQGLVYAPELPDATAKGLDATIEDARDMLMVLQNGKAIDPASQEKLMGELKAKASPQNPVYATVIYTLYPETGRVGFHAVLVTGVKDGFVSYINPWGEEEKLPENQFKTSILSANFGN